MTKSPSVQRSSRLTLLVASTATFLPRCSSISASDLPASKIWLPGATGSGPYDVAHAWVTAFGALYPEAFVTLSSVGSGAAQDALWGDLDCEQNPVVAVCDQLAIANATRETLWGLGDAPMKSSVYDEHPDLELQQFPTVAGAVAIVYSKEVGSQLNLTFDVLSAIFNRTIAFWDDSRIALLNPNLVLPHQPISKIVRADSSGQTSIVTDALGYQVQSWPDEAVGKLPEWPLGPLQSPQDFFGTGKCLEIDAQNDQDIFSTTQRSYSFEADGKTGVSLGLMRVPYSIGYMEMGFYSRLTDFLEEARIGNAKHKGIFTSASPQTLTATMAGLADHIHPDTLELNLATAETPPGGFPIAGYAYWYIKKTPAAYKDCYQAWLMCKFVEWSYLDPQAAELALDVGWVIPPQQVVNKTLTRLNQIMCTDTEFQPPRVIPAMTYVPPPYRPPKDNKTMLITVLLSTNFTAACIFLAWYWDHRRKQRLRDDSLWMIKLGELKFGNPPECIGTGKFGEVLLAEYRGTQCAVKRVIPLNERAKASAGKDSLTAGSTALTSTLHLNKGIAYNGLGSADNSIKTFTHDMALVSGSLPRGLSATNMITLSKTSDGRSNSNFGSAKRDFTRLKKEFVKEMRFLSKLRHPCVTTTMGAVMGPDPMLVMEYMSHGSLYDLLHNETMIIDEDMAVNFLRDISSAMQFLHSATPPVIHGDLKSMNILVDNKNRAKIADFGLSSGSGRYGTGTPLWMAPELLRQESGNTLATDVYSFGIIVYEVYARRDPYEDEKDYMEVLRLVADRTIRKRPAVPRNMPEKVKALFADCVEDEAEKRPSFEEVDVRLKRIEADTSNVAPIVKPGKNQMSLLDIFPKHIAETLQKGGTVQPEHKECVTIFFSDIVGFTTISSELMPAKVASLLDRLYTKFDALSDKHELFKVETIGDAYMAVTNLVKDQEEDHVARIARFAIEAVEAARSTLIDEEDPSKGVVIIRAGFHSGPVVADVVGTRNPRYCLFGDTVNTASRMESSSEANRINCSRASAKLLREQYPKLPLKARGEIKIKGKGMMHCYFINEKGSRSCAGISSPSFETSMDAPNGRLEVLDECPMEEVSGVFSLKEALVDFSETSSVKSFESSVRLGGLSGDADNSKSIELSDPAKEQRMLSADRHVDDDEEMGRRESALPRIECTPLAAGKGPLTKMIERSQRWLRLDEEVFEDEVSV